MAQISCITTSVISLIASIFLFFSCNNDQTVDEEKRVNPTTINYSKIGDSLSTISQQTLLKNVSREMKSKGPVGAIDFCNLNASILMDSLSKKYNVAISRISSKPRNIFNKPTDFELEILKSLETFNTMDTVTKNGNQVTYFKSIKIGMQACLKCHGTPETDISKETLKAIEKLYPHDLAKNYRIGDFRGAWKIQFKD